MRWPALFVLLAANFMNLLDISIMNIALPTLQKELGATESGIQWVVEVYILAYALGLLPFGRLGDIVGRKRMFLTGVLAFLATSGLCAAASGVPMLVAARALQGVAAAMMAPQVMAIATLMFPPKERAEAFALFGLVSGLAGIAGPVLGGLLLHANFFDLGWRQVFLINIPIGLVTAYAALSLVPRSPGNSALENDWVGIALAGAATIFLIFPLVEGRVHGWPTWGIIMMAAAAPLFYAFVTWERGRSRAGRAALLPIDLMGNHDYRLGAGSIMVFFSAIQGFFLVFAIFLQSGLSFSPLHTGLSTAPFPLGILVATTVAARKVSDLKSKIMAGAFLLVGAFIAVFVIVDGAGSIGFRSFMIPLFLGGLGAGLCISSLFQAVLRTVPLKDVGSGSGAVQVIQQIGGALGIAVVTTIFFSGVGGHGAPQGPADRALFTASFQHTLIYDIAAFSLVGLSALFMKFVLPSAQQLPGPPLGRGPRPSPASLPGAS
jgi:EmrB/QacA subfamily drug resistance transporter